MSTKTTVENTPGVGVNLANETTAQEAVAETARRNGVDGRHLALAPNSDKQGIMAKAKSIGEQPVRLKHVGAAAGVALAVVGYEYLAARKDWGFRLGVFKGKGKK